MSEDTQFRTLKLFTEDGLPLGNLGAITYSFVIFPEDRRSRQQALAVFDIENQAYHDEKGYSESELVKALITWIENRAGQRYAAGLTMLAFQLLFHKGGEDVTLYRATQIVEAALRAASKHDDRPMKSFNFKDGDITIKGVKVPMGQREIQKAYRAFESVSHLLGAEILATNSLEELPLFERSIEMNSVWLNTASKMEQVMLQRAAKYFGNPWLVTPALRPEIESLGAATFDGPFIDFVTSGL